MSLDPQIEQGVRQLYQRFAEVDRAFPPAKEWLDHAFYLELRARMSAISSSIMCSESQADIDEAAARLQRISNRLHGAPGIVLEEGKPE